MPNSKLPKPSVKSCNNTTPPSTIRLSGWLNKQKHGKCRAWVRRYFVLYGDELRYFKNKNDTNTLAVIYLDHYSLVPNAQPLTSLNQKQWRYNTFCLVSDDETKFDWPDYFLQAENENERRDWVSCLEGHVYQSQTVLEKWLERLDIPNEDEEQDTVSLYSRTGSDRVTVRSSILSTNPQQQISFTGSSYSNLPSPRHTLKSQRSVESMATFTTKSSDSRRRRPSDFVSTSNDLSNKLFASKLFNWKSKSPSVSSEKSSLNLNMKSKSSELLDPPNTPSKPIEFPIIHPSEYNQDPSAHNTNDAKQTNDILNDQTTNFYYSDNLYHKENTVII